MSNNPNNPFHLHSNWTPFTSEWQCAQSPQNPTNPQGLGFSQYAYPTPPPYTPGYNPPPPSMQPPPQMTPEDYTQFQMWRQSQQQPDFHSVEVSNQTPEPSRKTKGKKSKKDSPAKTKKVIPNRNMWTPEDELRLAESWISVSENSNRGTDQTGSSFWYLVMDSYNSRNPPFVRGKDALTSKWTKLNTECNKFQGIWNRLNDQRRSGEDGANLLIRCHHQYKVENEEKNFTNLMAWNFLKDKQKWLHPDPFVLGRRNVPRRRDTVHLDNLDFDEQQEQPTDENPTEDLFGDDAFTWPQGKSRKSKSQKTTSSGSAGSSRASFDETLAATFEGIRNDKQDYYKTKDLEAKLRILSMSTDNLPEQARIILEMEKRKICDVMGWPYSTGGPLSFNFDHAPDNITMTLNPNSWTKMANVIFADMPAGAGFSYATTKEASISSDSIIVKQANDFLRKFLIDHPKFLRNPLYIAGISYVGIVTPIITLEVYNANERGDQPALNIQGYILCSPLTDKFMDFNSRIEYAHRMALISDGIYMSAVANCRGNYVNIETANSACQNSLQRYEECTSGLNIENILEPLCNKSDLKPYCREYYYDFAQDWANDEAVQQALNIRKGTIGKWDFFNTSMHYMEGKNDTFCYAYDIESSFSYHKKLVKKNCRALIFSGDHDMTFPYVGIEQWIGALNLSVERPWEPFYVDGQVGGYDMTYTQNDFSLTFATVKGAGHSVAQYKPKESMVLTERAKIEGFEGSKFEDWRSLRRRGMSIGGGQT